MVWSFYGVLQYIATNAVKITVHTVNCTEAHPNFSRATKNCSNIDFCVSVIM